MPKMDRDDWTAIIVLIFLTPWVAGLFLLLVGEGLGFDSKGIVLHHDFSYNVPESYVTESTLTIVADLIKVIYWVCVYGFSIWGFIAFCSWYMEMSARKFWGAIILVLIIGVSWSLTLILSIVLPLRLLTRLTGSIP